MIIDYQGDFYYSNCFIEAVRAKIKYGNKISLRYISPFRNLKNYGSFSPHVYWINKETNQLCTFHAERNLTFLQSLFFKGHISVGKERKDCK